MGVHWVCQEHNAKLPASAVDHPSVRMGPGIRDCCYCPVGMRNDAIRVVDVPEPDWWSATCPATKLGPGRVHVEGADSTPDR